MKNRKIKLFTLFELCILFPLHFAVAAELWLKDIPLEQLKNLYDQSGYNGEKGYLMLPDHNYPPIFLENFPKDFSSVSDETERNALFIKIVSPLALKLNQNILQERKVISEKYSNMKPYSHEIVL